MSGGRRRRTTVSLRRAARCLARRAEALALLGTIPAFYLALLARQPLVSAVLYLVAAAASAGAVRGRGSASHRRAGLGLATALLLCALLPAGDAGGVLLARLGTAGLVVLRWGQIALPAPWRSELPRLLALGIGVFAVCGLGFWWLEPNAHSVGDGLWLAFTTAATVGYGDIVPSTPAAKIFAVFVVLMGLSVFSLLTASIAALWVRTEERRIEREVLADLHGELRAMRAELAGLRQQLEAAPARGAAPTG